MIFFTVKRVLRTKSPVKGNLTFVITGSPVSDKGPSDLQLVERGISRYGSAAGLAQALAAKGIRLRSSNTPNVWLARLRRGGSLSADKRYLLAQLLGEATESERERPEPEDDIHRDLLDLLRPDAAMSRIAHLPPGYQQRYRERVEQMAHAVQQQLDDFLARLEAEAREGKGKKGRPHGDFR